MRDYNELVVLGILSEGPKHGYEILQLVRARAMHEYIKLAMSSLYKTLDRLERKGFVTATKERVGERPERKVYRITREGEERLKELIRRNLNEIQPYYDPLYAALAFAHLVPPEEVISALKRRREHYRELLDHLRGIEAMLEELERERGLDLFFHLAIVRAGIKGVGAELEWLDETISGLSERRQG